MLQLDDVQLYDLSEAGSLLFKDAVRLAWEARLRRIPSARAAAALGLPAPWVEAEAGASDADPVSLCSYWLQRLAPPAADARRPLRAVDRLPATQLLERPEAARRLCATERALERLEADGTLPPLRVAGAVRHDEALVDLVAAAGDGAAARAAADARRALVRGWARFEYGEVAPLPPPPRTFEPRGATPAVSPDATREAAETPVSSPGAWEIPADLDLDRSDPADGPTSDLMDVDGFETVDED